MIYPIRSYGDPVLRKKAKFITEITDDIKKLSDDLIETLKSENGLGLAAPQIGISLRAIAVDISPEKEEPYVLLNPVIVTKSPETELMEEGCLSFPEIYGKIERPYKTTIQGMKINGEKIEFTVEGLESRAFQHEHDHLEGILFVDRMSASHKIVLKSKLKKLKKNTLSNLK